MRIDLALLADYALVDKAGKLTAVGIFRQVIGSSLPLTHVQMFLALIVAMEPQDDVNHEIDLRLIDPDGHTIFGLKADMDVQRSNPETEPVLNLVLQLNNVQFKTAGLHCFDISVDGRFMERVPLDVVLAKVTNVEPPIEQ